MTLLPTKDPDNVEPYFIVWCDDSGLNDGSKKDNGELQGSTIAEVTWTVPEGIVKETTSEAAISIQGIDYPEGTVTTIWVSGGTEKERYLLPCKITTSDGRTLNDSIIIPVGEA